MLEVTILKTKHAGRKEADKLFPYIRKCDVYAPEIAASTTAHATYRETEWETVLLNYKRWTRRAIEDIIRNTPNIHPDLNEHRAREHGELFSYQRLIWIAERFSEEDAQTLTHIDIQTDEAVDLATQAFDAGLTNDDTIFRALYQQLQYYGAALDKRDKHIAANIETAEPYLRTRYRPHRIAKKDPLKLTISIGGTHYPEKYLKLPCNVVILHQEFKSPRVHAVQAIREGKTFDDVRPLLVEMLMNGA